jgi:hypothetical protein
VSLPDEDFLLLQLHYLRRYFRTFESALPLIPDHMELRAGESGLVRAVATDASGQPTVVLRVAGIEFRPPTAAIEEFRIEEEKAQSMALTTVLSAAGPRLEFDEWGAAVPVHTPYKGGEARAEKRGNTRHRSAVVGDRAKERKASRKRAASLRAIARLSQKLRASAFSQVRPPPLLLLLLSLSLSLSLRACPNKESTGSLPSRTAPQDGLHIDVLFDRMDTRRIGALDFATFRIGCRRVARVPESLVTDRDVKTIFRSIAGSDNVVTLDQLADFLVRSAPAEASAGRSAEVVGRTTGGRGAHVGETWDEAEEREAAEEVRC